MDVFLFAHGTDRGANSVFSPKMTQWLKSNNIHRCVVYMANEIDTKPLLNELIEHSNLNGDAIEVRQLQLINTSNATSPRDLNRLPWAVLNEMVKQIDLSNETVVFCGRGNALFDHLLWLASQCFQNVSLRNIETTDFALDLCLKDIGGDISPQAISGLLDLHIKDIMDQRDDGENIGYSDAERLGNIPGAGLVKGINKSLGPFLEHKMVGKTEVTESSVTYNLLPGGLGAAIRAWMDNRPETPQHSKSLNIVFGRLPHVQTTNMDGKYKSFDEFFGFISPLQPVDGLLAVVQRHDDSIEGRHVLRLDQALEVFQGHDKLIGDLRHCADVLHRRAHEDVIQTSDHLVVINPVATPAFQMEFVVQLLAACASFEKRHGQKRWKVDITGPVVPLRSAVSFFSFLCNVSTTYIVKDKGGIDRLSSIRKQDRALSVPNATAFGAFSQRSEGHKNNKGATNLLIALLLCESMKVQPPDEDDIDPFDEPVKAPPATARGLTQSEIVNFVNDLQTELSLNDGLSNINRTIRKNLLVEQGLIERYDPPKEGKPQYSLTYLGEFVAIQLERIRREGVGN